MILSISCTEIHYTYTATFRIESVESVESTQTSAFTSKNKRSNPPKSWIRSFFDGECVERTLSSSSNLQSHCEFWIRRMIARTRISSEFTTAPYSECICTHALAKQIKQTKTPSNPMFSRSQGQRGCVHGRFLRIDSRALLFRREMMGSVRGLAVRQYEDTELTVRRKLHILRGSQEEKVFRAKALGALKRQSGSHLARSQSSF